MTYKVMLREHDTEDMLFPTQAQGRHLQRMSNQIRSTSYLLINIRTAPLEIIVFSHRAPMNILTVCEAVCKAVAPHIITAPIKIAGLRPSKSDIQGAKGSVKIVRLFKTSQSMFLENHKQQELQYSEIKQYFVPRLTHISLK